MMDGCEESFVCPLTREECVECREPRANPFTGSTIVERCAFATRDGACSIARMIQAVTAACSANERRY